jgi:TRAP-type mannitol/chloroaromatic compound transport system permease small subunit
MVATAWTLQDDGHVRVDIFYTRMTKRNRALVDMLGTVLFLAPFCIFVLATAWPYVSNSWMLLEGSREAGGLPLVFLLKSLILIMPVLLLGQCTVNAVDAWQALRGEQSPGHDG